MKASFTLEEILQFVDDHVKSKIDHEELGLAGINNESDLQLYKTALFEGIVNGIYMAGLSVKGFEEAIE